MEINSRNNNHEMEHLELFAKKPVVQNIELLFKNYAALKKKNKIIVLKLKGINIKKN